MGTVAGHHSGMSVGYHSSSEGVLVDICTVDSCGRF